MIYEIPQVVLESLRLDCEKKSLDQDGKETINDVLDRRSNLSDEL